jgi:hypothetical protein
VTKAELGHLHSDGADGSSTVLVEERGLTVNTMKELGVKLGTVGPSRCESEGQGGENVGS